MRKGHSGRKTNSLQVQFWSCKNVCYNSLKLGSISNNELEINESDKCRLQC
jgi:hypothetical protein